jgi:hypothetical protein
MRSRSYRKKFSVPDISNFAENFTTEMNEILNELFDVSICCFLITQDKYYC